MHTNHDLTYVLCILSGDQYGKKAQANWVVVARGFTEGWGPYQWFRSYKACTISSILDCDNPDASKTVKRCCLKDKNWHDTPTYKKQGLKCHPRCVNWNRKGEASLAIDAGFYYHFEFDPKTGEPKGCPGFDDPNWKNKVGIKDELPQVFPNCTLEAYAPEDEKLHEIVEDYAANQQKWFDDFVDAMHKMSANGYEEDSLTLNQFEFSSK